MMYTGPGVRFFLTDPQGSVVGLTNAAGVLQASYRYSAFGVPDQFASPPGGGGNRLRYTGQRLDAEIGLYDYRARAYSPTLGRFLQTDPIGYGDGLNLYAYVGNDPVNFGDPSGLGAEELQSQFQSGALAPGGLLFNQGVSSIGRGDYLLGGAQIAGSFAEATLAVATVGQGTALLQTTRTATSTVGKVAITKNLVKPQQNAINSYRRRIAEHQKKLAEYKANPDAFDNKGLLRNAPNQQVRQRIIDGRVRHLEKEIQTFQENIRKILNAENGR